MPLTIRRARPDELDAVGRLTVDAYVSGGVIESGSPYLSFLSDAGARASDAQVWVAVDDRGIVGTVTYVEPGSPLAEVARQGEAEIRTLAVAPGFEGKGVGSALLRALLDDARELGVAKVFCLTFETEFFARHGFVPIEGQAVTPEVFAELLRSYDEGVAEFLDLERVKPNTLGNTRMLCTL